MSVVEESAPSITRVHTLHRVRTVVNYVHELEKEKASQIDDISIAKHLISTHLSKPTTSSFRDQIGRRARDHMETARYLGLLYRIKSSTKYRHALTLQGKQLTSYSFEETCPKDYKEEAILIDRVCRMKMTNASYMQTPRGYEKYRSRICLNILSALDTYGSSLSLFQIGSVLSQQKLDAFLNPEVINKIVDRVTSSAYQRRYLDRLTQTHIKNIRRNTGPFIDWCAQLDLVRINNDLVNLTSRGKTFLNFYGPMLPFWWHDFNEWPSVIASAVLLINYLKLTDAHSAIEQLLHYRVRSGLFSVQINNALQRELKKYFETIIDKDTLSDFSFQYDVPPESWTEVENVINDILKKLGYTESAKQIVQFLEMRFAQQILSSLKSEASTKAREIKKETDITIKVTAASIFSQFRSPYEASTYMHFKALETQDFKTEKYQAQLGEFFTDNKRWENFSRNNPDLLIINNFIGLLECKSAAEWGSTLKLRKGIINEIASYNEFCKAVKELGIRQHIIVVISYEGEIKGKDKEYVESLLREEFPNVIIVTDQALKKALINVSFQNTLRDLIKGKGTRQYLIEA